MAVAPRHHEARLHEACPRNGKAVDWDSPSFSWISPDTDELARAARRGERAEVLLRVFHPLKDLEPRLVGQCLENQYLIHEVHYIEIIRYVNT